MRSQWRARELMRAAGSVAGAKLCDHDDAITARANVRLRPHSHNARVKSYIIKSEIIHE